MTFIKIRVLTNFNENQVQGLYIEMFEIRLQIAAKKQQRKSKKKMKLILDATKTKVTQTLMLFSGFWDLPRLLELFDRRAGCWLPTSGGNLLPMES